jgi:hypothetical protein
LDSFATLLHLFGEVTGLLTNI